MHPVFSDLQNDIKYMVQSYQKIIHWLALIGFPLSIFLYFVARELVLVIFGMQWEASVPVFKILALTVGPQIILSTSGSVFQAANATKVMFFSGLFSSLLNAAGILIGILIFGTLNAVAWFILITFTVNFLQCYLLMYTITFKTTITSFVKQFTTPLFLCLILVIIFSFFTKHVVIHSLILSGLTKTVLFSSITLLFLQLTGEISLHNMVRIGLNKFKLTKDL
jgi:PST family polysaccharide transporter